RDQPAHVVVVGEGPVGALPRLVPPRQPRLRLARGGLAGLLRTLRARQPADLDVLHVLVAELLVEGEGAGVLDDHLEPDALDAASPRLLVNGAHERLTDAAPSRGCDDAHAADPPVPFADGEVREPD